MPKFRKKKQAKPVSLHPLKHEEALAGLLRVKPEKEDAMEFETGDRVRLRREARVALQSGVEPGAKGTVGVDDRQHAHTVIEGSLEERLITVNFDGFTSADLVEESALEAI